MHALKQRSLSSPTPTLTPLSPRKGMNLQFKSGPTARRRPAQPGHAGPHIITHPSGTTHDDADLGIAGAGLTLQQPFDVETVADDDFPVNFTQRHRLHLAHEGFGAGFDAPCQFGVAVAGVRPGQEARDADAAADEEETVCLQERGAGVLWVGSVKEGEEVAVPLEEARQAFVLPDD